MSLSMSVRAQRLSRNQTFKPVLCSSCAKRRHAATAAATTSTQSASDLPTRGTHQYDTSTSIPNNYKVRAGIVLSRAPQITRELHPFEKAFFLYQRRMNERTAMPFPRYFYIHKETPAEVDWKRQIADRKTPARDIGKWSAWDREEGWNDEVLVGSTLGEPSQHVRKILEDAQSLEETISEDASKDKLVEQPQPRDTLADQENDTRSLKRSLSRNLYLLVLQRDGLWRFPSALIEGNENLHRAAERVIVQTGGLDMNTWIIGNAPIGYHTWRYTITNSQSTEDSESIGEKTFFMKSRIMAGKLNLATNVLGFTDHQWLSKDEIQRLVKPSYWNSIKNMLPSI